MNKSMLYIIVIIVLIGQIVSADSENSGYAGAFLKVAVEARPAAMGGAYIAVSNDAAGQLYNPAGITASTSRVFTSSYRAMKLDRTLSFISIVFPTRLQSALGLSWLYAGSGEVVARNEWGQDLGKMISANEHNFAVTFGKQFTPFLGTGAKFNFYHKEIFDLKASSVGINLGVMFSMDSLFEYGTMEDKMFTDIKVGVVFDNMAAKYSWSSKGGGLRATTEDEFPISAGCGFSCRTFNRKLLIAVDAEKNLEQSTIARFGAEYSYNRRLALRAGMDDGVFTTGAGFSFDINKSILFIDYAFSSARVEEGSDHIFSMHLGF